MNRKERLAEKMEGMPEGIRYRWCEPGELGCSCLGGANCSGGLFQAGFKNEECKMFIEQVQAGEA